MGESCLAPWVRPLVRPSFTLAFVLTACVAPVHHDQHRAFEDDSANRVFAAGYSIIQDKYIQPISSRQVAAGGLKGLSTIDAAVTVEFTEDTVHLSLPGGLSADMPAPARDDPEKWASVTTSIISVARAHSKVMNDKSSEDLYQAVFKSALSDLDRFSRYSTAAAARNTRAAREGYGGIGVHLRFERGRVLVDSIMSDTPAANSGLQPGDMITRIDDLDVARMEEAEVIDRLRGRVNSQVSLTVVRSDKPKPLTLAVSRALIVTSTVDLEKRGNTAIVKLSGFNQSTSRNLARALERAQKEMGSELKGVVLDMRNNPGGLLDQAVGVSDLFMSAGRIVSTKGRHADSVQLYEASGRDQSISLPIVVLVNGQSASAAEIVAAALQDSGRAVIVGSNTYGKGTVQSISRLPNDGELILTWSFFHAPSGYKLHNLGIMPNVCTSGAQIGAHAQASEVLDQLNPAWARLPVLMAEWRVSAAAADDSAVESLRENCPRTRDARDLDMAVATELLADPALYRRALQLTSTSVAGPSQASPVAGTTVAGPSQ